MYKTITMPADVFEMALSDKTVRHTEFPARQDGVIHPLYVLPGSASFTMSRFTANLRRFEKHLQHEAETRLQTMVSHLSVDLLRTELRVRFDSVRDMINELASEINVDVVVIGSHNSSISTRLPGSNALSVIRHAHIPVTVARQI